MIDQNSSNDPYLSRPVRVMRKAGILTSWSIWLGGLCFAFVTGASQVSLLLIMVLGFVPYIISIQLVEPWLMRRVESSSHYPLSGTAVLTIAGVLLVFGVLGIAWSCVLVVGMVVAQSVGAHGFHALATVLLTVVSVAAAGTGAALIALGRRLRGSNAG
jgi:hypothetical protein